MFVWIHWIWPSPDVLRSSWGLLRLHSQFAYHVLSLHDCSTVTPKFTSFAALICRATVVWYCFSVWCGQRNFLCWWCNVTKAVHFVVTSCPPIWMCSYVLRVCAFREGNLKWKMDMYLCRCIAWPVCSKWSAFCSWLLIVDSSICCFTCHLCYSSFQTPLGIVSLKEVFLVQATFDSMAASF